MARRKRDGAPHGSAAFMHLLAAGGMILLHGLLLVWAAITDSPTLLEATYISSGIFFRETGSNADFPQNPPLPKILLTVAALFHPGLHNRNDTATTARQESPPGTPHTELIRRLGPGFLSLVHLSRLSPIVASVLCGWLLYGLFVLAGDRTAGCWATLLWCFSALSLGNGHLATADIFASLGAALALLAVALYARFPRPLSAALLGSALALAVGLKYTHLLLVPPAMLLVLAYPARRTELRWLPCRLGAFVCVHMCVLYAGFFFSPPLVVAFPGWWPGSGLLRQCAELPFLRRFFDLLPADLVFGVDWQALMFERARDPIWFLGELRQGPVLLYYPVAFLLKEPVSFLALMAVGTISATVRFLRRHSPAACRVLFVFSAGASLLIWAVVCSKSTVCQSRYLTAFLPFGAAMAATGLSILGRLRVPLAVLAATLLLEVLAISPHYVASGNFLAGGPYGIWYYLSSEDVDVGQNLYRLRRWLDTHEERHPVVLAVGPLDVAYFGLSDSPAASRQPQAVVVSVGYVTGERPYWPPRGTPDRFARWVRSLHRKRPLAQPVPGMFLYEYSPLTAPAETRRAPAARPPDVAGPDTSLDHPTGWLLSSERQSSATSCPHSRGPSSPDTHLCIAANLAAPAPEGFRTTPGMPPADG